MNALSVSTDIAGNVFAALKIFRKLPQASLSSGYEHCHFTFDLLYQFTCTKDKTYFTMYGISQ